MPRIARGPASAALILLVLLAAPRLASGQRPAATPPHLPAADSSAILTAERSILDAYVHKDTVAVNRPVAAGQIFAQPDGVGRYNWTGGPATVRACETAPYVIDRVLLRPVGRDGAVLAYRYVGTFACGGHAYPDTSYAMAVYERSDRAWKRAAIASINPDRPDK